MYMVLHINTSTQTRNSSPLFTSLFILSFVSGAACFFVKHVQTGMCINVTGLLQVDASWGSLSFVELSNNCLDPAAQSRFRDNSAMFNLKRKGCFEATFRATIGYDIDMLYMLLTPDPLNNCVQKHAITQTSWGGLSVYYKGYRKSTFQTWCVVPKTYSQMKDQGIDPYIGLTTDCNDAEDKRFNFGKLFLFVCS